MQSKFLAASSCLLAALALGVTACGGDDNDPGVAKAPDCLTQGIVPIRIDCGRADAQVDHADAINPAIGHDPVESGEHIGGCALPLRVQNPQINEFRVGSDARICASDC